MEEEAGGPADLGAFVSLTSTSTAESRLGIRTIDNCSK
jgi:hypothetical protein